MVSEAVAAVEAAAASADPCTQGPGSGEGPPDVYDLGLHVAAIGIMLAVSLAGALAPVALRLSSSGARVGVATKLGTFFGFGTILATALIHMLPPAAESLSSPCLPPFFRGGYNAWANLFVMLAMMGMHLIDYLITVSQGRWKGSWAAGNRVSPVQSSFVAQTNRVRWWVKVGQGAGWAAGIRWGAGIRLLCRTKLRWWRAMWAAA